MSPEKPIDLSVESDKELIPVERFDILLAQMLALADKTTGSIALPKINIISGQKPTPTQVFVYNPELSEIYEVVSYQPQIIMERGQKIHEVGTGKILHDSERLLVQRPLLESFDLHDEEKVGSLLSLIKIENYFKDYKKAIEDLKKNEQSRP